MAKDVAAVVAAAYPSRGIGYQGNLVSAAASAVVARQFRGFSRLHRSHAYRVVVLTLTVILFEFNESAVEVAAPRHEVLQAADVPNGDEQ
jgi:hypothetical protein